METALECYFPSDLIDIGNEKTCNFNKAYMTLKLPQTLMYGDLELKILKTKLKYDSSLRNRFSFKEE